MKGTIGFSQALIILVILGLSAAPVGADTYVVRPDGTGDFPTIQAAIDAAEGGDIIELTNGTFTGDGNRDVDYSGKAITLRSQSGDPELSIIDCEGSDASFHRGFYFHSGEGPESVLEGVTITRGYIGEENGEWPLNSGGGILFWQGSATINNVIFQDNLAVLGGGMSCVGSESSPTFSDCSFLNNTAWPGGGGASVCRVSSPSFFDCEFYGNSAQTAGGAIASEVFSSLTFENCTFVGNVAETMGGAWYSAFDDPGVLSDCTVGNNAAPWGSGVFLDTGGLEVRNTIVSFNLGSSGFRCDLGYVVLTCCDVYGNEGGDWVSCIEDQFGINGNISEDPLFCDPEAGDFTLHADSPCAPFSPPNEECDLIGAWPVGCEPTATTLTTWGRIKGAYR